MSAFFYTLLFFTTTSAIVHAWRIAAHVTLIEKKPWEHVLDLIVNLVLTAWAIKLLQS